MLSSETWEFWIYFIFMFCKIVFMKFYRDFQIRFSTVHEIRSEEDVRHDQV